MTTSLPPDRDPSVPEPSPTPDLDPDHRNPEQVVPAGSYCPREQVWVFRHGEWHFGVVEGVSPLAVMVTYQRPGMRGTVVDTVPPECLLRRHDRPQRHEPLPAGGDR